MRFPWANLALLIVLVIQLITGYLGFVNGMEGRAWLLWLHGIGAYTLVLLLFWKGAIIWQVWSRGKRWTAARISFVVLLLLLLLTLLLGVLWTFAGLDYFLGFSLLSWHIYLALPLMVLLAFHAWRMRWVLELPQTADRRAFLRMGLISLAGAALWWTADRINQARRFTGSYEIGSFGGWFPRVSWINDAPEPVDPAAWQLTVAGLVEQPSAFSYRELADMTAVEQTATLDCTGGWYSIQEWKGVPLTHLLAQAGVQETANSVRVQSVTGYWRRFSLEEAARCLLALEVAGQPLSHGHGFPVRLVVPDKRGFEWVKWVTEIRLEQVDPWWQPPLPLQ